nr:inositol monophosphatase [Actinomycetales bacterium]
MAHGMDQRTGGGIGHGTDQRTDGGVGHGTGQRTGGGGGMGHSGDEGTAHILEVTRGAAREVAAYLREVVRSPVDRDEKEDFHDIVTEHDRRAEVIATAALRRAFPACTIVGEEHGVQLPGAAGEQGGDTSPALESPALERTGRGGAGVTFYVDPIDGTSNFVAGMPTFAVSIGASVRREGGERLEVGVVNAPLLGHEFYAARGMGAWVDSWDADGPVRLGTPWERKASECLVLTTFPGGSAPVYWGSQAMDVAQELKSEVMSVRGLGTTAIELAFVAAGWADGTYGTHAGPWDLAAGFVLVEESGGRLSHAGLLGEDLGEHPWERVGYAASGPGRELDVLHGTLAGLDGIATAKRGA